MTFRSGDKVRCIDARHNAPFSEGAIYTVERDCGSDVLLKGYSMAWMARRFELVESKPDDGFIPFDPWSPNRPNLKEGDRVRIETDITSMAGTQFRTGATGEVWVHVNDVAAVKPGATIKPGDMVRHPEWDENVCAEVASIRDGKVAFWNMRRVSGAEYGWAPNPRPVSELTKV